MVKHVERNFAGRALKLEAGRLATQAAGACLVQFGEPVVLPAVTVSDHVSTLPFFPLTVEYREKAYAAGKIPGGFLKREGRPSDEEILAARVIDRSVRPLFPEGFKNEVQVFVYVLSADQENDADVLGLTAASAALTMSQVPWNGPIAAVRVGRVEGAWILNPTFQQLEFSDVDMVVSGGKDSIVMVEGGALELTEAEIVKGLEVAQKGIRELLDAAGELVAEMQQPKMEWTKVEPPAGLVARVKQLAEARVSEALNLPEKSERAQALAALRATIQEQLAAGGGARRAGRTGAAGPAPTVRAVPLHHPHRVRHPRIERLVVHGNRVRRLAGAVRRGRADDGRLRRRRDGAHQGGGPRGGAHRHPGHRGPAGRHGLQGCGHAPGRYVDPDGHQDRGPRVQDRERSAGEGEAGPAPHSRHHGPGDPAAALAALQVRAAHHHRPDSAGQDRRPDRPQGQDDSRHPGADGRRDQCGRQRPRDDLRRRRGRRAGARHGRGARAGTRGGQGLRGGREEHHGVRGVHRDPPRGRGTAPHLRAAARAHRAHRGRREEGRPCAREAARGGRARPHAAVPQGAAREAGAGPLPLMETVRLDREISQTTAPNGVIVLSERVASVRSAAVGIWVRSASAHEPRPKMGVSHLLEHMVFKGTARRTAQEIALALESRGGSLDAYTSRDTTAFQARVLDQDLPRALDVLTDLVRNPTLKTSDLELERNVVLEEINMVEDAPDDQVFDLSYQALWPDHPYGYSILGTRDTVRALSADDLKQLHGRAYFPGNCVIAAAGNLAHEQLLEELAKLGWFDAIRGRETTDGLAAAAVPPAVRGFETRHGKETAQTHIVFATDTVPYADRRKYALLVLGNVFGGGMSSRLFQRIREELGLAYAIYSFTSFYRQMGVAGVYVGTQPKTAAQAVAAIRQEYAKPACRGVSGRALAEAKQQTRGQLVLSLEGPTARTDRLAGFPVYGEPYESLDQMLAIVDALAADDVASVAGEFFAPERQRVIWLGPMTG